MKIELDMPDDLAPWLEAIRADLGEEGYRLWLNACFAAGYKITERSGSWSMTQENFGALLEGKPLRFETPEQRRKRLHGRKGENNENQN